MDDRDEAQFREYVAARQGALLRSALLLTGNREDAEDLLQAALIKLAIKWATIQHNSTPDAYVRTTMYHQWVSWWRRHRRGPHYSLGAVPDTATPGDLAAESALRLALVRVLSQLTPRQRAVIALRYYEDLSETEVAQILGCSVGTVRSQAYRTLARLRQLCPDLEPAKEFDSP